jgi:glucokinase
VNDRGKVLREIRAPIYVERGKQAVLRQIIDTGKQLLDEFPKAKRFAMASAGPLDVTQGVLLDPTNYLADGKGWGQVPIVRILEKALKRKGALENDAAAAALAEAWIGAAKKQKNSLIMTLGTGIGVGVIAEGKLVRAGRGLHPEGGHLTLRALDETAPCGCGNYGCIEAYLSGKNFTQRVQKQLGDPSLTAERVADYARARDARFMPAFAEYSSLLAAALHSYVRIYAPELIVFTGSFAAAHDLFLSDTRRHLEEMLKRLRDGVDMMPKLAISSLDNRAGLIGAAHVALNA